VDREEGEQYNLIISASDGDHKAITEVQVIVKDENDCAPVFDRQVISFSKKGKPKGLFPISIKKTKKTEM
jgi:hypothetical protein